MADDDNYTKEFAKNILQAIHSGQWPLPDAEQIVTTLAEMVVALAEDNEVLRELYEARQEAVDGAAWIIAHANLIKA